jgi:hypothetical protein
MERWCKTLVATTTGNSAVALLDEGTQATTNTLPIRIIDVVQGYSTRGSRLLAAETFAEVYRQDQCDHAPVQQLNRRIRSNLNGYFTRTTT